MGAMGEAPCRASKSTLNVRHTSIACLQYSRRERVHCERNVDLDLRTQ